MSEPYSSPVGNSEREYYKNLPFPKWRLLGTMCGRHESLLKYESIEHPGLMKEINTHSGKRGIVYYWEDSKPIYKTYEEAINARALVSPDTEASCGEAT